MDNNYQPEELEQIIEQITEIAMTNLPKKVSPEAYAKLTKEQLSEDVAWLFVRLWTIKELVDLSLKDNKITKAVIATEIKKSLDDFRLRQY